ncbi:NADPH-dependent F420 reductase [Rhizobium esperanzae]|uniref:Pyrroline-5-carboxylate reductase catalytic N-terminal domain-containing protein n=1 Tax=Rhizobium esperanzae TaxID=1967781 RepID=A0A7W6W4P7_9HYPH|nr:NAD(P)-binding domain-containing protein [Rhizobium esperanzae]MBB4235797.1 hypothetical protein [Rhizobium esperanzae]
MNIGIIGAGNIGGTIAKKLVAAGHSVKLAGSKGPDAVRDQAEKIGAVPATARDAVKGVEVIVLSIPFAKIPDVAELFADVPADVTIIDTSNYYPQRDGQIAEVNEGKPESIWVSEQLGRPVIKAFNAVLAYTLGQSGATKGTAGRIAIPVAGDDQRGKSVAQGIVETAGFDALDAGDLADSWRQQPGSPAYCTELSAPDLRHALASADQNRSARDRDRVMNGFMRSVEPISHEAIVARNREVTAPR